LKIAVDTSALIAIIFREPEAKLFKSLLIENECHIVGPSLVEAFMVVTGRNIREADLELAGLIDDVAAKIVAFDVPLISLAQQAFLKYGKGRHPAKLNFGDCMSYALAKSLKVPLLYKGDDFARTDIVSAL
jgi:ribonuclease VapC